MKKIISLVLIAAIAFIACNDTKDPPDDNKAAASTETPPPPAVDTTILTDKPVG